MTTRRTQLVLLGVLALQAVLILLLRNPFADEPGSVEARTLLPGLEGVTPSRIEIEGGEDDQKVTLRRAGNGWEVAELDGFPADAQKIETLVADLGAIRVRRPIVSSERYHDTFRVEDDAFEARIRVWSGDAGDPQADLIVGKSANYQTSHARVAGEDAVYEIRGLTSYQLRADTAAWIVKDVFGASPEQVTGIALANASGTIELERDESGGWRVVGDGPAPDAETIEDLVRTAASVRFAEAVGPREEAHGLAAPAVRVTLRWPGGAEASLEERTLLVGAEVPGDDAKRYVTREGLDHTAIAWSSSVEKLLDADVAALAGGAETASATPSPPP
jgi:hypothetical protein